MIQIGYPFRIDGRGHVNMVSENDHIRQMIEQVLFTAPGERVNRPTFGSGIMQLVFAPNSEELAAATQFLVQGSLQQWLGESIQVESVEVECRDALLEVTVTYTPQRTQTRQVAQFSREI